MAEKEINEALFALRQEVERLEQSHPAVKERLEALLIKLETRLEAAEDDTHVHLLEDVKQALTQFEVEHPRVTGILNDLMVTLSNLGI